MVLRIIYIDLFDGQRLIRTMKYGGLHSDVAPFRNAPVAPSQMLLFDASWQTNYAGCEDRQFTFLVDCALRDLDIARAGLGERARHLATYVKSIADRIVA